MVEKAPDALPARVAANQARTGIVTRSRCGERGGKTTERSPVLNRLSPPTGFPQTPQTRLCKRPNFITAASIW